MVFSAARRGWPRAQCRRRFRFAGRSGGGRLSGNARFLEDWERAGCPEMPGFSGFGSFFFERGGAETGWGWVGWAGDGLPRLVCLVGSLRVPQSFFQKVRDASRSDYVIPASRPSRKLQAVPGEGFSPAVTPRNYPARRWCTSALVALRGGCPPSRAVRRPAFAVTLSSVIRGGDEPLSELSVLARKRSGDRGDLSFPVVTGIG